MGALRSAHKEKVERVRARGNQLLEETLHPVGRILEHIDGSNARRAIDEAAETLAKGVREAATILVGKVGEFRSPDFWTSDLSAASKGLCKLRRQLSRTVCDSTKEVMTLDYARRLGEYRSTVRLREKELREKYLQGLAIKFI